MLPNRIIPSSWPLSGRREEFENNFPCEYSPKSGCIEKKKSQGYSCPDVNSSRGKSPFSYLRSLPLRRSFQKDSTMSPHVDNKELKRLVQNASKHFISELKVFKTVFSRDIQKQMIIMIEEIWKERHSSILHISKKVQSCYNTMKQWLEDKNEEVITENIAAFMDCIERYLMSVLYNCTFERICKEENSSDKTFYEKITSLQWLTPAHLGTTVNEADQNVMGIVDKAVTDILAIDLEKTPLCKLKCILECSKKIFTILEMHNSRSGADEFLPLMVYIILKANPPSLCSNIQYIQKFSYGERITKGEEGYYFTHLCSVLLYIENITPEFLNISEEEFRSHFIENDCQKNPFADKLFQLFVNAAEIKALHQSQNNLMARTSMLEEEMKILQDSISKDSTRINAMREERTNKIQPCAPSAEIPNHYYSTNLKIQSHIMKDSEKSVMRQTVFLAAEPCVSKEQNVSYLRSNILNDCSIEKAIDALELLESGERQSDI